VSSRIIGTGLNVSDLDRSVDFYTRLLGFTESARHELDDLTEVVLAQDAGAPYPGVFLVARPGQVAPVDPASWGRIVLGVRDVRGLAREITEAGYTASEAVETKLTGQLLIIVGAKDPDGYELELVEIAASSQ
jgi:catechol 2,3-dioxygenase-like lactoylglutathione lyase family enzyme